MLNQLFVDFISVTFFKPKQTYFIDLSMLHAPVLQAKSIIMVKMCRHHKTLT